MPEIRFNDDYHKRLRARVAKHRAKHKARLRLQSEQASLQRERRQPGPPERWVVRERVSVACGLPIDVVLFRVGDSMPEGCFASCWLPSSPVSWALGLWLRRQRLQQIGDWLAPHHSNSLESRQ